MADEISLESFAINPDALKAPATDPLAEILEAKRRLDEVRRVVFVHPDRVEAIRAEVEKEGLGGIVQVRGFVEVKPDTAYVAQMPLGFRQRWICEPGDVYGGVADE